MTGAYDDLRAAEVPVRRACTLIGRARATHYRHQKPPVHGPARPRRAPDNGQALTDTECAQVLALINTPKYTDLAICQIWARELDEGNYWCSKSSMYRIAKAAGQTRERRRQATHPAKVKPELLAEGPSQVWTWDITKLRGPAKGIWYHLYVIIDIFSRYNPSWLLSATESAEEAEEFIEEAVNRNGAVPHTVHADRGTSMTSGSVSELLANLGIDRSHSRPRTSNDNPFSDYAEAVIIPSMDPCGWVRAGRRPAAA
jgi:putative transposase